MYYTYREIPKFELKEDNGHKYILKSLGYFTTFKLNISHCTRKRDILIKHVLFKLQHFHVGSALCPISTVVWLHCTSISNHPVSILGESRYSSSGSNVLANPARCALSSELYKKSTFSTYVRTTCYFLCTP